MRHRTAGLLGLGCLLLVFKGDSCFVDERTVDVVVTADVPATWHTGGSASQGSDTRVVNANFQVQDALDNLDGDTQVTRIRISGVCYEVLENQGFVGAHSGTISVDGRPLLAFDAPSNAAGVTGGGGGAEVHLVAEGVTYVNDLLAQYLAGYNAGSPDPALLDDLTFAAAWTSTPPGEASYNFDWKTCLILQIVGNVTLDVPNP